MGYDVIGDIHGQAAKLEALLRLMGYAEQSGLWVPPAGRQAVFLGDLIDRGPEQVKVVDTVRRMVDAGYARCVMGNHEFNALGYATPVPGAEGGFLRRHCKKNTDQHAEFLRQVGWRSDLHQEMLGWFATLPPALDLGGIRVVHAWWHKPYVDIVRSGTGDRGVMSAPFLHAAHQKGTAEWDAMEGLTKGLEITLPPGYSFFDHTGVERFNIRTRWWLEAPGTYQDVALVGVGQEGCVPDIALPAAYAGRPVEGPPVFVGHYWMQGQPVIETPRLACLDWSEAKDGPLVAYRWDGEFDLTPRHLVWAGGSASAELSQTKGGH